MPRIRSIAAIAAIPLIAAMVTACGGGDTKVTHEVTLIAPVTLITPNKLTFCSDIGYPPLEFERDGNPTGADIDIARGLAQRMQVKVVFHNTPFDGILEELGAKKCDAIISAMTDTEERRAKVAFINYLTAGQSLLVPTANEFDIASLDDLAGHTVAVQAGTTNQDFLTSEAKSRDWGSDGAPTIKPFQDDADAAMALKQGTADAYYGDSPTAAYYIGEDALTYAFAGKPINAEPIGIAVRIGDPLEIQLKRGIDAMYADGSMKTILARWKLSDFALNPK